MYHYRECGLSNVYLANGFLEVVTSDGPGIAIEDVEGLHRAIAQALVERKPTLAGVEVRFIRKLLGLTQAKLGAFLGVGEQTVRNWESADAGGVPTQADRGVRLVFRDITHRAPSELPELIARVESERQWPEEIPFRYEPRAREHWLPECEAA